MHPQAPGLSKRLQAQLEEGSESPLLGAIGKTFGNQYDPDSNPNGVINAGMAENVRLPSADHDSLFPLSISFPQSLMQDWTKAFFERPGTLKLVHTDFTYGQSVLGSNRLLSSLTAYYTRFFSPVTPVQPQHFCTSNGATSSIERLAACISDEGDSWLFPTPYYNSFPEDLGMTSKVGLVGVHVPEGQHGEMGEIEALEAEMVRRKGKGATKITAVLVTNPHNPLGFCYKREILVEYCRFAQRHSLYLIVDEIYALSVFDSPDMPNPLPFTSILSIDPLKEAECNPARVVQLYGMSKDFGANGFRAGNLCIQHNPALVGALAATAFPARMGSPTDILWSALLDSPELSTFLTLNRRALSRSYSFLSAWLRSHNIAYRPANAGHFILADFREHVRKIEPSGSQAVEENPSKGQEVAFLNKLVDEAKVYLGPGFSYAVSPPYGFFRITFSLRREELEVALNRIEKMCGFDSRVAELSKEYPQ
ncbi:hypothetical protein JCM8097_007269 [Rhodosporidiobolus ruineniae]